METLDELESVCIVILQNEHDFREQEPMDKPVKWLIGIILALTVIGVLSILAYRLYFKPKPVPPKVEIGTTTERQVAIVPSVPFTDVTQSAGITFAHYSGATENKLLPETMGSGVAVIDYDCDGKTDLLFVNSCPWPGHKGPEKSPCLTLYRNKGDGTFEDVTIATGLNTSQYGVGACVGDYDNDGFPDLFITCVGSHRLFHNEGGKKFRDVTANAGVGGAGVWPKEESAEQFVKHLPPIPFGTSATFLDFDGDGKLDLFVCHYCSWSPAIDLSIKTTLTGVGRTYQQPTSLEGNQCSLYRNKGDGTFEDVSEAAGVKVFEAEGTDANARLRPVGKSLGVVLFDPDADGWPDLVVANDTVRNFFLHNMPDGNGGRKFVEQGVNTGLAYVIAGGARGAMGVDVAEHKPGKQAVLIANFANEPNTLLELIKSERIRFQDQAAATSLEGPSRGPLKFGAFFFDYDLDGRLDILTCNGHIDPDINKVQGNQTYKQSAQLFWNAGSVYEPVTKTAAGPDLFKPIVGRGSAFLDYDNDGDLDVVLIDNGGPALLLRNDQKTKNNWVRFQLEGDGTMSNRSAIGAEVTIEAGGATYRRMVVGARGYLSQSEFPLTFGLSKTETIDKVTVRWPGKDAKPQTWTTLKANTVYKLKQGEPAAR
jgi:enediyne biosynthesis protein E4